MEYYQLKEYVEKQEWVLARGELEKLHEEDCAEKELFEVYQYLFTAEK